MDADQLLETMRKFFAEKHTPQELENFAELTPQSLLKESLDVVDFVVYLEEELGVDIDMNALGEALINKNFGELSQVVAGMLSQGA